MYRKEKEPIKRVFGITEAIFDIIYLLSGLAIGIALFIVGKSQSIYILAGFMSLVLVIGDAFHLAPRIRLILSTEKQDLNKALGRGKQITSITMSIFYILLFHLGLKYFDRQVPTLAILLMYLLGATRIALCLLKQNKWEEEKGPYQWAVIRNIPFFLQGYLVFLLFFQAREGAIGMGMVWWGVLLSFFFYGPVVLWVNKYPKLGMLMLPKTLAYLWILVMCLFM